MYLKLHKEVWPFGRFYLSTEDCWNPGDAHIDQSVITNTNNKLILGAEPSVA